LLIVSTFQTFSREFSRLGILNSFRQRNEGIIAIRNDSSKVGHRFREEVAVGDHELRTATSHIRPAKLYLARSTTDRENFLIYPIALSSFRFHP
jgi:hypothetical protein